MAKHKLSASAISTFLKSPRAYYWRYVAKLEPAILSVVSYDHDKLAGILWSAFVQRFYDGMTEANNTSILLQAWADQTEGWVPQPARDRLTKAMEAWASAYYQTFSPTDGCRIQSEVLVENDMFLGYLDGISADKIIHEVKSTSRSPQLAGQLWKVTNSIQVKLYAVLTQAEGVRIEFAWKDSPYGIFRGPMTTITAVQRAGWEQELTALGNLIYSLGDDINNYPCHPDGCSITGKHVTSMCSYETLCTMGVTEETQIAYKPKTHRK